MSKSKLRVEYKTRQPKAPPDSLDIGRSVLVCNVFVFLFSAAKASLFPFLTLYMRYLGFSASQTGLIVGGKTFSALVMAPLWARCAGKRNKRKFMLMFSILMLAAVYLSLTLIPTLQVDGATVDVCSQHKAGNKSQKTSTAPVTSPAVAGATVPASSVEINSGPSSTTTSISTTGIPSISSTVSTISTSTSVQNVTTVPPEHIKIPNEVVDSVQNLLESLNMTITDLSKLTAKKIRHLAGSVPEGQKLSELLKNLNPKETSLLMTLLAEELAGNSQVRRRDIRDTWSKIKSKVSYYSDKFLENIQVLHKQMFLCVLMILIIGEIFCSPVEKLADDAWYDFLDEVDDLEKYGRQRLLTSFAFILFPILTTLLVDMTPCYLGEHIYHQSVHFYVFGGCLGLTFVVAMFYPVPTPGKRKYVSKVMKGCRVIFCGGRNFIFIVSLLVMGIVYSTSNYLFWVVQDLGGKELPMGVSVAVAAFSEFPMLVFSGKLVQKLGNGGVIALSMLVLSLRQVYYSFLWLDWAVVPIEVLHSISHTAMWWAMLSNPDFSVNSQVDRSIRSILSSLYFGMGYGVGSIISGFVYDEFGHQVLFRAAAVLVASWMLVFFVINRCIPTKTRIRYAKLLSAEDGELSDSSNDFEEDWLEQALRDH